MTKEEARQKMNLGYKITHESFTEYQYLYLKQGQICDNTGEYFPKDWGWGLYSDEKFNTGWSVHTNGKRSF